MEFKLRDPQMVVLEYAKEYERLVEPEDFRSEEECFLKKRGSACLNKERYA